MKSAALELGRYGITVNAIIPGLINTALTRHRQRYAQAVGDLENHEPIEVLEAARRARRQVAARPALDRAGGDRPGSRVSGKRRLVDGVRRNL